ncbi:MAG: OmpH family outer membrane protein [Rhodothermales bacterium]
MCKRVSAVLSLLLFASPLLIGSLHDARAQALDVGYTDHEIIIVNMPEYQTVQQQLQSAYEGNQQELQTLYQDYQERLERYQRQQSLLSDERRAEREQELMDLQQDIQEQAQAQDQQLAERESQLMQPLLQQVQTAINEVAEARGLDIVLRSQVGTQPLLLYVNPETITDITLDVARNLGLDVDETDTSMPQDTPPPASSSGASQ